mmetsp:Transcript_28546/g.25431  ORF Transcript_28546/g.25431 Transcript_28546/m.25431 type:complete len:302 (-) Transcript_28546:587-1492(-)
MISKAEELSKGNLSFDVIIVDEFAGLLDGFFIVRSDHNLRTFVHAKESSFDIQVIGIVSVIESIVNRVSIAIFLGQLSLFDHVGTSNKFGTNFNVKGFAALNFEVNSLSTVLEITLEGIEDHSFLSVVNIRQLHGNRVNSTLNVGLFSIDQKSNLVFLSCVRNGQKPVGKVAKSGNLTFVELRDLLKDLIGVLFVLSNIVRVHIHQPFELSDVVAFIDSAQFKENSQKIIKFLIGKFNIMFLSQSSGNLTSSECLIEISIAFGEDIVDPVLGFGEFLEEVDGGDTSDFDSKLVASTGGVLA